MSAATCVIASQGLAASTAAIAKEAGVSNGSLFVYFDTKAILLNELYVLLKTEMATAAIATLPAESGPREQLAHMWSQWLSWATTNPDKRRTLAQLQVADEITPESHETAGAAAFGMGKLLARCRANGPLSDAPLRFVLALTTAIADATIDAVLHEPARAEAHSKDAFDAMWRVLAGSSIPVTV